MRILQVAGSGAVGVPPMGPVTNDIFQLATEFHKLGHETAVADVRAAQARELSVPCLEIEAPRWGSGHSFEAEGQFADQLLKQDLRRFDIVHAHDWKIAHELHRRGIRSVYTSHTPNWAGFKGLDWLKDRVRGFVGAHERKVIRDSLLTIALGDYLRVRGANVTVIQNGIRADRWIPEPVAKQEFTILFIGRIVPLKGVHVLIEALRLLSFPSAAYILGSFVGKFESENGRTTEYAEQVQKAARDLPITFTGFIPNTSPEFRRYVCGADVVVVPSLFEPQGNVVLEALAMGIPVIGSNTGGIPLMLTPDVGILVPPGDASALAAALTELHRSPARRAALAANARPHVMEHCSWEICARRHIECFERVMRKD